VKFWMFLATVLDDISEREREERERGHARLLWIRVIREDKIGKCVFGTVENVFF